MIFEWIDLLVSEQINTFLHISNWIKTYNERNGNETTKSILLKMSVKMKKPSITQLHIYGEALYAWNELIWWEQRMYCQFWLATIVVYFYTHTHTHTRWMCDTDNISMSSHTKTEQKYTYIYKSIMLLKLVWICSFTEHIYINKYFDAFLIKSTNQNSTTMTYLFAHIYFFVYLFL